MKLISTLFCLLISIGFLGISNAKAQNRTIYVDSAASGANDGSSWADAYQYLNDALTEANGAPDVTEVKIANGTYYPTGDPASTDREASFVVTRDHLKITGGYSSGGGNRTLTGLADRGTILSGNIGDRNSTTDNSLHVMLIADITGSDSLVLDGLQISDGHADENQRHSFPGISLRNIDAAGIFIDIKNTPVVIQHCIFTRNYAKGFGGGLYVIEDVANLSVSNALFADNIYAAGSAIYLGGKATVTNCTIVKNDETAIEIGDDATLNMYNSILSNEFEIYGAGPGPFNIEIHNCIAQGALHWGSTGDELSAGVIDVDPKFVDPENGDFRLKQSSFAINAGSISHLSGASSTDIAGNPRAVGDDIDMGAFEFQVLDNNISNNGDDNFNGLNGTLNLTGSEVTRGADPVSYFWQLDISGTTDTEALDTTLLINPEDYAGFPLALVGITLDSNHFIISNLAAMPNLIDLAAGSGGDDFKSFTGDINITRTASAGGSQHVSNSQKITITSDATPVEIFNFRGVLSAGIASFSWQTGVENHLSHFELQRNSGDANNWQTVATITPTGSGSKYQHSIPQITAEALYRLKAIDKDRSFSFADNIVALEQHRQPLSVYPSPATTFINLQLQQAADLVIFDASGKQVLQKSLNEGANRINIQHLTTGIFYGRLSNGQHFRFVKQ